MNRMLFNLEEDVGERLNLSYQHPEVLSELQQKMTVREADIAATTSG